MKELDTPNPAPASAITWTAETELKRLQLLHEQAVQLQREGLARKITFGVLGGFGLMMIVTYALLVSASDPIYSRAKDLLLFINPLIGIVIGYYFSKGRAEKAEASAQTAEGEKRVAEEQAKQSDAQASEAAGALKDLSAATKDAWGEPELELRSKSLDPNAGIERGESPVATAPSSMALQRALSQAEQVLARIKK